MKLSLLVLTVSALLLGSCQPKTKEEKLIGNWQIEKVYEKGRPEFQPFPDIQKLNVEFTKDSVFLTEGQKVHNRTTWQLDEDTIKIDITTFQGDKEELKMVIRKLDEGHLEIYNTIPPSSIFILKQF